MKKNFRTISFLMGVTGLFILSLFIKPLDKKPPKQKFNPYPEISVSSRKIYVPNEWEILKETVLGSANLLTHVVCEQTQDGSESCSLKLLKETNKLLYEQLSAELKNLENVMIENGVRVSVHDPELLPDEELFYRHDSNRGVNFLCARTPLLVAGGTAIETAPFFPEALSAKFSIRRIINSLLADDNNAVFISMPEPSPAFPFNGVYLDAADVLVDGENVYVGSSGLLPNPGAHWLKQALEKTHHVYEIRLKEGLRLGNVMALPNKDILLLEKEAFLLKPLPAPLRKRKQIEILPENNTYGLADMVVLSPEKIVINEKNTFLKELLEKEGFEIITLPFDALEQTGVNLRCLYHPLKRTDK